MIIVPIERNFEDWRMKARELLAQKIPPHQVNWQADTQGFSFGTFFENKNTPADIKIPRDFFEQAFVASCFRDDSIWSLLYRLAWRLVFEDKNLLKIEIDPDTVELNAKVRLVNRDLHKMKAFVRFKELKQDENESLFMAWHRPDHRITRLAAPFFKDRFNGMKWVIMTEDETILWDKKEIHFLEGVEAYELPQDEKEDLWKTYYSSIFNPARIKVSAMKKELPVRHWKTLPETELITSLLDEAPARLKEFYDSQTAPAQIQEFTSFEELNKAILKCKSCGICEKSSGPVFGEGPLDAEVMILGEQPGNEEDLAGKNFIGPAGQILNEALNQVGLKREEFFVTNVVKSFKWVQTYDMRQHRTADAKEISACRPWVQNEIKLVKPKILVCLGRSAAQSVLGKMIKLEDMRGKFFSTPFCENTIILPHPASILRDKESKDEAFGRFIQEFELVKNKLDHL